MIATLRGLLTQSTPSSVVIEAYGVGYKVFIPVSLFQKLPQLQEVCFLHTSFIVRENSQALYGFEREGERDLFDTLLTISGIGPKVALNLLGHLSEEELYKIVEEENLQGLCRVPGIGKKTGERFLVEMKSKVKGVTPKGILKEKPHSTLQDAMSALIHLGYNQQTAQKALQKTLEHHPEEEKNLAKLITLALKYTAI